MMGNRGNCAVKGCSNSHYKLYKWKKQKCNVHEGLKKEQCGCNRPFNLYCLPSSLRNSRKRKKWKILLKREGKNKKKWNPCDSDRVCSVHFVDGTPTIANPDPSLNMDIILLTLSQERVYINVQIELFNFENKYKDHDDVMESNLKTKSSHLCKQLPIPSFSKVTQCIPFSIPSYNYDIGYLVSNYASYSSVAKTLSNSEVQHLVQSVSESAGNFIKLLHFRIKAGDKILEDHLKYHQKNASYISNTSQNELINCCGEVVTDKIIEEIKKSQYFSNIADEASDSSNKEQLSLVIRFVDSNLDIKEEFVKFIHCLNGVTGEGLFRVLLKSMSVLSLDIINCRGQSYDGARAILNVAICVSYNVQSIRNLLTHVKEVSYFFNLSPTSQQKLEEHIDKITSLASKKKLKDVCRTRWIDKVHGMDTFQELFIPVVSASTTSKTFNHTVSTSASSLPKLITGFDFIVALCITRNVFDITLPITRLLQGYDNFATLYPHTKFSGDFVQKSEK
ncbi:52 kDa repressor of the inhibitor of the protein kinase-like [Hydra vulgaris]|uniref:52 kDa repressor of the inhibitor of the protein kinase-like n=1 Tax=Hydra vulgaris TaxID=6087 RepID=A0ABM4BPF3_HYDVU